MYNKFCLLTIFLSFSFFCNADVEYHIIPLSLAGEEFDLTINNPQGPNSRGQTIGWEFGSEGVISWVDDPDIGRIILPMPYKYCSASPLFITDNGHVVGHSLYFSYIWSLESGLYQIVPPSGRCYVQAANNLGEVVFDDYFRKGYYHAHLLTKDKNMIELGTLGGLTASGRAINDFSQIVGRSEYSRLGWWEFHAFIWDEKNGMRDLNDLIPQDSGWRDLSEANYINNEGLIIGTGIYQDQSCEFLLIPMEQ